MRYEVLYTSKAKADLADLDKKIAIRIIDKVDYFVAGGYPLKYAKKLTDFTFGTYRFRVGDYRVIFDLDNKGKILVFLILKIGHRKDIYF